MANELLDFVMSLARDPDVAARYAADPAQTLADAHLSGVTSADVNSLLPLVSDSLSMGTQSAGDASVWTSGAATAAFDAFGVHSTAPVIEGAAPVIDTAHTASVSAASTSQAFDDAAVLPAQPDYADVAGVTDAPSAGESPAGGDPGWLDDWHHPVVEHGTHDTFDHDHGGF